MLTFSRCMSMTSPKSESVHFLDITFVTFFFPRDIDSIVVSYVMGILEELVEEVRLVAA